VGQKGVDFQGGGNEGGETQYVLPSPSLNRLWGFGESLAAQRPPSTSSKRELEIQKMVFQNNTLIKHKKACLNQNGLFP
jgi:hypothetical protein